MRILLVLAHPDPDSFNHAIAAAAREVLAGDGHEVVFHDLYADGFDPVLPAPEMSETAQVPREVAMACEELHQSDGLVFVHPNWWGQPPAVLKGWIDRVFRPGIAYRFLPGDGGEGVPEGLLRARTAVVFNTSNTRPEREIRVFGDPLEQTWTQCILGLCGVTHVVRRTFATIADSTSDQREKWLKEVRIVVRNSFQSASEIAG
jgi:NAD(P)H dehydrogenase (quinone)